MSRQPLTVATPPHLRDHHFEGQPVFPSVLALELLAGAVRAAAPDVDVRSSRDARFLRWLPTDPGRPSLEAQVELSVVAGEATARASLLTLARAGRAGLTRALEHVAVSFGRDDDPGAAPTTTAPEPALWQTLRRQGLGVEAATLYAELVPFGPSFHNALDPIWLAPGGALGLLRAPTAEERRAQPDGLLGSPYPLDAAMHLACAWSQHFCGAVTFPTGYTRRRVLRPTRPGERYTGCVVPARPGDGDGGGSASPPLTFDLWICGLDGGAPDLEVVHEVVEGLRMEDLSRGRLRPPERIRAR